ncbi:hypothetical protein NE237_009452 [Protea cynaroides]|uniref:Uncharacterized protein n=1 Tax=Protea cynaroides TaxID=273540 RepID=A0A9Q0R0M9_9MAGN|nr:hypothetical protein NE237_009452 [Protea cynaroides]
MIILVLLSHLKELPPSSLGNTEFYWQIYVNPTCRRCGLEESIHHILLRFPSAGATARNAFYFDSKVSTPLDVICRAERAYREHKDVVCPQSSDFSSQSMASRLSGSSWIPPPSGSFKLNVDAAFNGHKGTGGLGFVI